MATDTRKIKTKKPTPLSTRALAAYLTWKQFDILLLLEVEGAATTGLLADFVDEIQQYDERHGGAFYQGTSWQSVYSCLRTLEGRRLVTRHIARNGLTEWTATNRAHKALDWLAVNG